MNIPTLFPINTPIDYSICNIIVYEIERGYNTFFMLVMRLCNLYGLDREYASSYVLSFAMTSNDQMLWQRIGLAKGESATAKHSSLLDSVIIRHTVFKHNLNNEELDNVIAKQLS